MKGLFELKQERRSILAQAKAIAGVAELEHRAFTAGEQTAVTAHLEAAERIKQTIDQMATNPEELERERKSGEAALSKAILDLGAGIQIDGTRRGKRANWGAEFLKGLPYQPQTGRKDLLPVSGSVTVGSMLEGIGEISDFPAETILQFLTAEPAGGDAFGYLRETVRQHNACTVEPGERKPVSVYTLERVDDRIRTIAHLSEPISRNWLADAPMLSRYLNGVLREGVQLELEYQILQGSGAGEDLPGMLNASGIQVIPFAGDILTTTRQAITALEVLPTTPTGWAIHPRDWEAFELLTELAGAYLLHEASGGPPIDRAKRRLWGLPVGITLGITQGTALLANWTKAITLLEREGVRIDWSEAFHVSAGEYEADQSDSTGFERNLVKFRAEGRWGLAINRPAAICEVELEAGS